MHSAKEEVSGLIRTLGFSPIDRGALRNAREIEDIPVQRFPLWKKPLIISTVLLCCTFPTLVLKVSNSFFLKAELLFQLELQAIFMATICFSRPEKILYALHDVW